MARSLKCVHYRNTIIACHVLNRSNKTFLRFLSYTVEWKSLFLIILTNKENKNIEIKINIRSRTADKKMFHSIKVDFAVEVCSLCAGNDRNPSDHAGICRIYLLQLHLIKSNLRCVVAWKGRSNDFIGTSS